MGKLDGKVAFITGVARGQGRSHAVRLAGEGADIVGVDLCAQLGTVAYRMATPEDLAETVKLVEKTGRRMIATAADVRDYEALERIVEEGTSELGGLDIIVANAGISPTLGDKAQQRQAWHDAVDIMLTGAFNTVEAGVGKLLETGRGGSIVIISSAVGLFVPRMDLSVKSHGLWGYVAAKHGVVGLMRAYATVFGPRNIRCNSIHPTGVNTPMVVNEERARSTQEQADVGEHMQNVLPVAMIEPIDISNAIVYLCSDDGRYVTGVTFPVDAGLVMR
jgi:SDR family mycofactocin-dependent oxidoreductase